MNWNAFLETLPIMAKGMGGIFAVTLVIILCMYLLRLTSAPKKKQKPSDTDTSVENRSPEA